MSRSSSNYGYKQRKRPRIHSITTVDEEDSSTEEIIVQSTLSPDLLPILETQRSRASTPLTPTFSDGSYSPLPDLIIERKPREPNPHDDQDSVCDDDESHVNQDKMEVTVVSNDVGVSNQATKSSSDERKSIGGDITRKRRSQNSSSDEERASEERPSRQKRGRHGARLQMMEPASLEVILRHLRL